MFQKVRHHLESIELGFFSDNHVMRYCDGLKWDFDRIVDVIVKTHHRKIELQCYHLKEEEFTDL